CGTNWNRRSSWAWCRNRSAGSGPYMGFAESRILRFRLAARVTDLPDCLENCDRDRVCQVQTTGFASNRNQQGAVLRLAQQSLGKAASFGAEDEGVARRESGIGIGTLGLGAEIPQGAWFQSLFGFAQGVHDAKVQMVPVIEAGPAKVAVIEMKSQGP